MLAFVASPVHALPHLTTTKTLGGQYFPYPYFMVEETKVTIGNNKKFPLVTEEGKEEEMRMKCELVMQQKSRMSI